MQTLTITSTPLGRTEKIQFAIPEARTAADKQLQQYIIDSLKTKMPVTIPMTFSNQSMLELAKHLLRHRTASKPTLSSYAYNVYRFSNWLNMQPDQMIQNCKDQDGDINPKAVTKFNKLFDSTC